MRNNKEKPVAFPLSCLAAWRGNRSTGAVQSLLKNQMINPSLPCKGVYGLVSDFIRDKDTCKHNLFYRKKIVAIASRLRWW